MGRINQCHLLSCIRHTPTHLMSFWGNVSSKYFYPAQLHRCEDCKMNPQPRSIRPTVPNKLYNLLIMNCCLLQRVLQRTRMLHLVNTLPSSSPLCEELRCEWGRKSRGETETRILWYVNTWSRFICLLSEEEGLQINRHTAVKTSCSAGSGDSLTFREEQHDGLAEIEMIHHVRLLVKHGNPTHTDCMNFIRTAETFRLQQMLPLKMRKNKCLQHRWGHL